MSLTEIQNIIKTSLEFNSFRAHKNYFSFILKNILFIIPSAILGNYTDKLIQYSKKKNIFGENKLYYIVLQTLIIISTLYLLLLLMPNYMLELQRSVPGLYFVVIYFGIQTNYIDMMKKYLQGE